MCLSCSCDLVLGNQPEEYRFVACRGLLYDDRCRELAVVRGKAGTVGKWRDIAKPRNRRDQVDVEELRRYDKVRIGQLEEKLSIDFLQPEKY